MKYYLVCKGCGEAFDASEPEIAYAHQSEREIGFELVTEDEAF